MINELFAGCNFPSPSGNIIDKLNEVIRALNAKELAATDSQQRYAKIAAEIESCAYALKDDGQHTMGDRLYEAARQLRQ